MTRNLALGVALLWAVAGICESKGKTPVEKETLKKEAVIETKFGNIVLEFLPKIAPKTVENFQKLAKSGFYDKTTFHRVIPGFMIQGGDPNTKKDDRSSHGMGGPGYQIAAEFSAEKHVRGIVSMARSSDPNSAGSQFFIMVSPATHLDGQYTAFARVKEGMEAVDKIVAAPRDRNDNPLEKVEMKKVTLR